MAAPESKVKVTAAYLALIILSIAVYINSLPNQFAFDDYVHIVNNPSVRSAQFENLAEGQLTMRWTLKHRHMVAKYQ